MNTLSQIKEMFDAYLAERLKVEGTKPSLIHVNKRVYNKLKYSCTSEERDLTLTKGRVYYKGIQVKEGII